MDLEQGLTALWDWVLLPSAGQFQNAFPELVGLTGYAIDSIQETGPDTFSVAVTVTRHSAEARLRFLLVRKDVGRKKGALMTKSLLREN